MSRIRFHEDAATDEFYRLALGKLVEGPVITKRLAGSRCNKKVERHMLAFILDATGRAKIAVVVDSEDEESSRAKSNMLLHVGNVLGRIRRSRFRRVRTDIDVFVADPCHELLFCLLIYRDRGRCSGTCRDLEQAISRAIGRVYRHGMFSAVAKRYLGEEGILFLVRNTFIGRLAGFLGDP